MAAIYSFCDSPNNNEGEKCKLSEIKLEDTIKVFVGHIDYVV